MDFRPLKYFLTLSDSLHFGQASELCHISSSTLSRSIKQLEDQLGVALFERDNRSVILTQEGVRFQTYARETLMHWEVIHNDLMAEAKELHGELSVYCSVTASYSFLYNILNEFRPRYPKIEIKLHTGDPELAIQHVLSHKEDFAIAAKPDVLPTGLSFKSITDSPLVFIGPANGSYLMPETKKQWQETPMILQEQGVARKRLNARFETMGIKPKIYAQVAGNEAIVSMVALGFGMGIVPKIVLENSPLADQVQILNIHPQLQAYDVGVCVLEKKLKNPLINVFWSQLSKLAGRE
ncbi:transcriptional regulator IlvY [Endozoicomonas sp. (ex Bugula neritina AB1)]|nr:transcriptional regulator IlvY [Endozoicomonas sp. (ex Bugula neritina AB1)]